MQIHVDWTAGVVRLLTGPYGSPYVWSASVVRTGEVLTIMGVSQMPENPHVLRGALREWCRENGISRVLWERYKLGGVRVEEHGV